MQASIKGVALQFSVSAIRRALDTGRLSWMDLEVALHSEDIRILEDKIVPGMWYPIASFGRILETSLRNDGITRPDQFERLGYQVASSILTNHVYDDMVSSAAARGKMAGFTLVGLAPLLLNFSSWQFQNETEDGLTFRIDVWKAEEVPEVLRHIVQGLIQYLCSRVFEDTPVTIISERPTPDSIVYRGSPEAS